MHGYTIVKPKMNTPIQYTYEYILLNKKNGKTIECVGIKVCKYSTV